MGAYAVTSRKKPNETLRKTLQVHQVPVVIKEPFPSVMEKLFMNLKWAVKISKRLHLNFRYYRESVFKKKKKLYMNYLYHHDNIIIKCINTK